MVTTCGLFSSSPHQILLNPRRSSTEGHRVLGGNQDSRMLRTPRVPHLLTPHQTMVRAKGERFPNQTKSPRYLSKGELVVWKGLFVIK